MRKRTWWSDLQRSLCVAIGALAVGALVVPDGRVAAFELYPGEDVKVQLDTTLSYSMQWRVQDRDPNLYAKSAGGNAASANYDDGNLNYGKGLVSRQVKIISELDAHTDSFGAFIRGSAFYDFHNNDNSNMDRTDLSSEAQDLVGKDVRLLDAYAWGDFDLGSVPVQVRLGEQVVNWGESTFILNSIGVNTINSVDVNKLRVPGAELREALVPEGMVRITAGLTDTISAEGLYVYDWEETKIDPVGTYFSTADYAGEGVVKVVFDFGTLPDMGNTPAADTFMGMPESSAHQPGEQGQYGFALRGYAPALNDTEFSLFFMNYHSKLPIVQARTGSMAGAVAAGTTAASAVPIATAVATYLGGNPGDIAGAIDAGVTAGAAAGASTAASTAIASTAATGGDVATVTRAYATDEYVKTMSFRSNYEDDIKLLGAGFSTEAAGVAIQSEISYRWGVPLQIDDVELLVTPLGVIDPAIAALAQQGDYTGQFETWIDGGVKKDVVQAQMTITKLLGPMLGASGGAALGEVGIMHVRDMPDKSTLRLQTTPTFASGDAVLGPVLHPGTAVESSSHYPDQNSWGYVLMGMLEYSNAIGPVTLIPKIAWSHDVQGISPGPGGPFLEGRKAISVALGATYLNQWSGEIGYTNYLGAGRYNEINDRDFAGLSVKYSF